MRRVACARKERMVAGGMRLPLVWNQERRELPASQARIGLTVLGILALCAMLEAEVKLASPFTSHLVLQRELTVPVWGDAAPGERVRVEFAGQAREAVADAQGRWQVELAPMEASVESRELVVSGTATERPLRLGDVLVGEVWLASGQSNMDFTVARTEKYYFAGVDNEAEEVAAATHPLIRMFKGEWQKAAEPCARVGGSWLVCDPETVREFSAVGYFFARRLHHDLGVPVGILAQTYGATTAQAWVSREAMGRDPRAAEQLARFDAQLAAYRADPSLKENHERELAAWRVMAEAAKAKGERAPRAPADPDPVANQRNPTVMFNGMIAPVVPYAVRGVIWYQGESIIAPRELFPMWNALLIHDWRTRWGRELPVYFVQLAGHGGRSNTPEVRAWQAEALRLPGTGMALAYDIGDQADVHPKNKQDVGDRLARLALARTYGKDVVDTGPEPVAVRRDAGDPAVVRVTFATGRGGIVTRGGGSLGGFELAGADGKFFAARATIENDTVRLRAEGVERAEAVRYAWAPWPEGANLGNAAGLPAAPFEAPVGEARVARE